MTDSAIVDMCSEVYIRDEHVRSTKEKWGHWLQEKQYLGYLDLIIALIPEYEL